MAIFNGYELAGMQTVGEAVTASDEMQLQMVIQAGAKARPMTSV